VKHTRALFVLLVFHATICVSGEVSNKHLQEWVDASTLAFTGTINKMGTSNVASINPQDDTMIVRVALRDGILYVRVLQPALHYELEQVSKLTSFEN
jgi:hypothetical protein